MRYSKFMLLITLLFGCIACQGGKEEGADDEAAAGQAAEKDEARAAAVEVYTLDTVSLREELRLIGQTEPLREANVTPELGGRVLEFTLREGMQVTSTDEVVMRVDTTDLDVQRQQIKQYEIQGAQLRRDIKRSKQLIAKGLGTNATLEQQQSQLTSVYQSVRQTQTSIDRTKAKALTRAPITGVVTMTMIEAGEFVGPGTPTARIVDISTIVVKVGLPERFIGVVSRMMKQPREMRKIPVIFESLRDRESNKPRRMEAVLHRVAVEANPKNRTFPLELHIPNPDSEFRAGMRVTVVLEKDRFDNVIAIPRDAILQAVEGPEAMVVDKDGTEAKSRPLKLGPGFGSYVVVTDGLAVGDALIVRGHRSIVQGEPVQLVGESKSCCRDAAALQPFVLNSTSKP